MIVLPSSRRAGWGRVTGWVSGVIGSLDIFGVAALMVLENLFPPIPSKLVLPLAGFLASRGDLPGFIPVLVTATFGSLLGAFIFYTLGRRGGRPLVLRYGAVLRLKESDLDRADEWFDRYGGWVVFFGRMVPGVRSVVSVPAGMSEMPLGRFTLLTVSGSAVWNAMLIGAGWYLGEKWRLVSGPVSAASNLALAVLTVLLSLLAMWWWRNRSL